MLREFINTFQTNLFLDEDFSALQSCLCLLKMLLCYHDPQVFKHLERNGVIPEMYSIPWFITCMASRMENADLVLEFWDRMLLPREPDITFLFFFCTAMITQSRQAILNSDLADLPSIMTGLCVKNNTELRDLIRLSEEIEENTPYSFKQLEEVKSLFRRQSAESLKEIS